jgi:hypothetical protein
MGSTLLCLSFTLFWSRQDKGGKMISKFSEWHNAHADKLLSLELGPGEVVLIVIVTVILAVFVYRFLFTRENGLYVSFLNKLIDKANFAYAPFTWLFRWAFFIVLLIVPAIFMMIAVAYIWLNVHLLVINF